MNINYNKIVFYCFTLLILFSLNGNNYLKYLEDNGFDTLKTIIEELAEINKENIRLKIYNENKVTKVLANFTPDYQTELIKKIKEEYKNFTTIDFEDESIKHCFLKGIIKNENFENFSVSSDNHTSLNFFTNVLDERYHIYLGDTIDKQREFNNKETLERLSLALLFTHITKGLFENIINEGKNAIYCAGNHDIGKVFNYDRFVTEDNTEIINFLKQAIRLTNFIECIVITKDTLIDFKHGNGKNTFETIKKIHKDKNILITLSKNSKTVYQNILSEKAKNYLKNNTYDGVNEVTAPYDISSNWGHIPDKNNCKNENLNIFKEITNTDINQQNGLEEINTQKNYIQFFGHFHGDLCNFDDYYLNEKKTTISPYIKRYTYSDTSLLSVFMPPSYHDNNFLKSKKMDQYVNNNEFSIDIRYHFSLPEIKTTFFIKKEEKENESENYNIKSSLIGLALGTGIAGSIALWNKNHEFAKNKFYRKKYFLMLPIIGLAAGYGYGKYCQKFLEKK